MKRIVGLSIIAAVLSLPAQADAADEAQRLLRKASRTFAPLTGQMPGAEADTPARIALGKKLFFDKRLSINDSQSCGSCHKLDDGFAGVDNLPTSPGATGKLGTRNSPSVLNAGWQTSQFWDGRAKDLVEQAKGPILNPIEMGMPSEKSIVMKLRGIDEYRTDFMSAFPGQSEAISYQNIVEAIAAFERTLRSQDRFDDFLNGDIDALNADEQRGLAAFIRVNCVSCHDGRLLGGELFKKLGEHHPYANTNDLGRYEVTKDEQDKMVFKVSSLRNVALTGPYFHDGSIKSLDEAVRIMAHLQLNIKLSDQDAQDIVSFLKSLSDKSVETAARP